MVDEREPGATFAPGDICFCDFESVGREPIEAGTDRYARNALGIILSYGIGDAPVQVWAVDQFISPLNWRDAPPELIRFFARVYRGEAVLCTFNANFDRAIWNHSTDGFPRTEPWMWIDAKVQAMASGLPGQLEAAAKVCGGLNLKDKTGKELIKLFTMPDSLATPQSHPDEWQAFQNYALRDVSALRDVFNWSRQLPLAEWKEYWASEAVNDTGVMIDLPFVAAAAAMASEDQRLSAHELKLLTNGAVQTVNQVQRMVMWLDGMLPAEGRDMLVKKYEEVDLETGEILKPQKTSLTRDRVVRLIAYLEAQKPLPAPLADALRLLQIRLYGGSKTPTKFAKMLSQHVDGVIRHQYVFGGASQTGRFSAKGVQIHNLARDPLPYEIDAIDALVSGAMPEDFATIGDDTPISRKLSLLIRPALIAPPEHALVWGDWANIEARLVPWLANDPEADERLDIFRAVDADPTIPDIYTRTAAELSGLSLAEAAQKDVRQRGKVVELACGFGGGTNALLSMAASYNIHLEEEVARSFVKTWREKNTWAPRFWGKHDGGDNASYGLWGALNTAIEHPNEVFEVGRVAYAYLSDYLGGSLLCRLPSGRWLTYRRIKWELVDVLDDDGTLLEVRRELMFSRDRGRVKLWPGLACENIVQATAADILRGTLVRLEHFSDMPVVLHTHDEVVVETSEDSAIAAANVLREIMEIGFEWTNELPIAADTTIGRWYSKSKESMGL